MVNKIVRADGTTEITEFKSFIYVESTNADDDLRPGGVYSARVEFEAYGAKTDAPSSGERLAYYQVFPDETETLIGYFYAEPVVATKATFQVTAYDAAKKLDTDFSKRLKSIQSSFPMTLSALVNQAFDVAGVTVSGTIPQSTWSVGAFYADNITCRQILGWAAEIACRYVRCNTNGNIVFDWYTSKSGYRVYPSAGTSSSDETYIPYKQDGLQYENYTVAEVGAVAVQPPQMSGTAYVYPSSATSDSNTLVIADNLLLTDNTDSTCTTLAQYIYNQMRSLPTYRPCTISTFPNESPLRAGDIVSVTDIQGVSFTAIITDFNASASAFKYGSKGNETYSKTYYNPISKSASQSANSVSKAELAMTQESIISTVSTTYETKSDASNKLEEAKTYSESQIAQTSESILSTVSTTYETKTDATEKLSTAKSYTESQISQFADSITLSVTNSGTSSTISISGDGITTQSKNIVFTGYVTFSNLSTSGQTTINGGNITTGTIQDTNGNVVLDLTNGTLTMKNGAIYLGTPTNNVYPFQVTSDGVLTAKSGTVGGFTISDSAIYTAASSATTSGSIYLSTSNFTRSINGTSRSLRFAIGSNFGVSPTGVLYATNAVISGSITATSLTLGSGVTLAASSVSGLADVATSGSYSDLSSTPDLSIYISEDGEIGTIPSYTTPSGDKGFVVTRDGLLVASNAIIYGTIYASAGTIGGFTLSGSALYTNTSSSTTSGSIYLSTSNFTRSINNTSRTNLRLAIGSNFGVSNTGVLYASNVVISGSITATSLTLGSGVTLAASNVSGLATVATSGSYDDLASTPDLSIYIKEDGTVGDAPAEGSTGFVVSSAGLLTASNAKIFGTIYASAGTIGGWTINGNYGIYTNSKTTATSTRTGILIQKDGGIYAGAYNSTIGSCPFQVDSNGVLRATAAVFNNAINIQDTVSATTYALIQKSLITLYNGSSSYATSINAYERFKYSGVYGTVMSTVSTFMALGQNDVGSFKGVVVNLGRNPDSYTEDVVIYDNLRVTGNLTVAGTTSITISGYVPTSRTVNSKALSSDITLSASDVSAAPTSHASTATTYGVGTTSNYGHCKVINNLTTSTAYSGYALNAYQGYVLNQKIDNLDAAAVGALASDAIDTSSTNTATSFYEYGSTTNFVTQYIYFYKSGNTVSVVIPMATNNLTVSTGYQLIGTVSSTSYRPPRLVYFTAYNGSSLAMGYMTTSGQVYIYMTTTSGRPYGSFSFIK